MRFESQTGRSVRKPNTYELEAPNFKTKKHNKCFLLSKIIGSVFVTKSGQSFLSSSQKYIMVDSSEVFPPVGFLILKVENHVGIRQSSSS